ncbi:MAG: hypothetical protein LBV07_02990 [Syntrophobacterales bacterium]|jgi:hypothetical protein|nr:hypothetical protein [Syntrophobacterales bacterium]
MSAKEQLLSILDCIGESEAKRILLYVKETYSLKPKTWDDIEEDDPSPDEIATFEKHRSRG